MTLGARQFSRTFNGYGALLNALVIFETLRPTLVLGSTFCGIIAVIGKRSSNVRNASGSCAMPTPCSFVDYIVMYSHTWSSRVRLTTAPVRPALDSDQLKCGKRCRTKAGEGVHMFRVHGQVAPERKWVSGTSCEACLKEFHTFDKLQVHLRTAMPCRMFMQSKPLRAQVLPGFGSRANDALRELHDGLLPVQEAQGPPEQSRPSPALRFGHSSCATV